MPLEIKIRRTVGPDIRHDRELRQLNRAVLLYEPRGGDGSIFRIVFSNPQQWEE